MQEQDALRRSCLAVIASSARCSDGKKLENPRNRFLFRVFHDFCIR